MRRLGHPLSRRKNRSPGQALVEFALVIPIFILMFVALAEFAFLFTAYVEIGFASHDGSSVAATYGNTAGADCATIERVNADTGAPANRNQIISIDIYWVDTSTPNGLPVSGAENIYTYDGLSHQCQKPDGTIISTPFSQTGFGYPEADRCNVNLHISCGVLHQTVDTIAVKITYQYRWITPFPAFVSSGSPSPLGPLITQTNVMRLEPIR